MDKLGFWLMIFIFFALIIFSVCYIFLDDLKNLFVGLTKKKRINSKLKKFAIDHDFPLLSDVVIQIREDKYIKIDHIMIGNKYIYVIACKCYYGYLNAKAVDEKWVLYRRDKLMHIENPLKNNDKRIKILSNLLENTTMDDFVNIIYLSKSVVASQIQGSDKKEFVLFEDDFEKFIEVYEKECDLNEFSIKSINEAAQKIYDYHNESVISFREINAKKDN
jgi:hypothetical protein